MFAVFTAHATAGTPLLFTSGPADGEAIGDFEGEPLYHASLAPEEYGALLTAHGFEVLAFARGSGLRRSYSVACASTARPARHRHRMNTVLLYVATALAEIVGCYLPFRWLRQERPAWLLLPASLSFALFAGLPTLHGPADGGSTRRMAASTSASRPSGFGQWTASGPTAWDIAGSLVALGRHGTDRVPAEELTTGPHWARAQLARMNAAGPLLPAHNAAMPRRVLDRNTRPRPWCPLSRPGWHACSAWPAAGPSEARIELPSLPPPFLFRQMRQCSLCQRSTDCFL